MATFSHIKTSLFWMSAPPSQTSAKSEQCPNPLLAERMYSKRNEAATTVIDDFGKNKRSKFYPESSILCSGLLLSSCMTLYAMLLNLERSSCEESYRKSLTFASMDTSTHHVRGNCRRLGKERSRMHVLQNTHTGVTGDSLGSRKVLLTLVGKCVLRKCHQNRGSLS